MAKIGTKEIMTIKEHSSISNYKKENNILVYQASTIEVFDTNVMIDFL